VESGADLALKCGSGAVVGTPVVGTAAVGIAVVGTAAASPFYHCRSSYLTLTSIIVLLFQKVNKVVCVNIVTLKYML